MRAAVLVACALAASPARASVPDLFGMGPRSAALAGSGMAATATWEAAYTNPAALAGAAARRLTLGYVYGHFATAIDGRDAVPDDTHATLVGAVLPLPLGGFMKDRLAIGLGFVFPSGVVTRARVPAFTEPRLQLLDTRTQVVGIDVAASLRVHDRVALGFGALALAALRGRVILNADAAGRIGAFSNQQLVADYAPIGGVRVQLAEGLVVGAAIRGESRAGFDVAVENRLGDKLPITLPEIRIAGIAQLDPMQAGAEAALTLGRTTVAAGATWKHWASFPRPTETPTDRSEVPPDPRFSNTIVPRVGVEHERDRLTLRGGVFVEPTPVAEGTPYLDGHRVALTAGAGLRAAPFHVDGFYQWHRLFGRPRASGMLHVAGLTVGVDL